MEIWKDIKGYPKYQISNEGRVWSKKHQIYLKPRINKSGYYQVCMMCINGKIKTEVIHRLVAINFIPNPDNLPQVNHKDGNKLNNNIDNLEWCTAKENTKHAYDNNLGGFKDRANKQIDELHKSSPHDVIVDVYYDGEYKGRFSTKSKAAEYAKVSVKTVYNRLHNRFTKRSGWDFKEVV